MWPINSSFLAMYNSWSRTPASLRFFLQIFFLKKSTQLVLVRLFWTVKSWILLYMITVTILTVSRRLSHGPHTLQGLIKEIQGACHQWPYTYHLQLHNIGQTVTFEEASSCPSTQKKFCVGLRPWLFVTARPPRPAVIAVASLANTGHSW